MERDLMKKALEKNFKPPICVGLEEGDVCTRYWRIIYRKKTKEYKIYGPYEIDEYYMPAKHVLSLKTCLKNEGDVTLEELVNSLRKSSKLYRKAKRNPLHKRSSKTVTSEDESCSNTSSATCGTTSAEGDISDDAIESADVEESDTASTIISSCTDPADMCETMSGFKDAEGCIELAAVETTSVEPVAMEEHDTASTVINDHLGRIGSIYEPDEGTIDIATIDVENSQVESADLEEDTRSTVINSTMDRTDPMMVAIPTGFEDVGGRSDLMGNDDSVCLPLKRDGGFWLDSLNDFSTNWLGMRAQPNDELRDILDFKPMDTTQLSQYLSTLSNTPLHHDFENLSDELCNSLSQNPSPPPDSKEPSKVFKYWNQDTNMSSFNFEHPFPFPSLSDRDECSRNQSSRNPVAESAQKESVKDTLKSVEERNEENKKEGSINIASILIDISSDDDCEAPPGSIVSVSSGCDSDEDYNCDNNDLPDVYKANFNSANFF